MNCPLSSVLYRPNKRGISRSPGNIASSSTSGGGGNSSKRKRTRVTFDGVDDVEDDKANELREDNEDLLKDDLDLGSSSDESEDGEKLCSEQETEMKVEDKLNVQGIVEDEEKEEKQACEEVKEEKNVHDQVKKENKVKDEEATKVLEVEKEEKIVSDKEDEEKNVTDEENEEKKVSDEEKEEKKVSDEEKVEKEVTDEEDEEKKVTSEEKKEEGGNGDRLLTDEETKNQLNPQSRNEIDHEPDSGDHPLETPAGFTAMTVWPDEDDDYLLHLEAILERIHKYYYKVKAGKLDDCIALDVNVSLRVSRMFLCCEKLFILYLYL